MSNKKGKKSKEIDNKKIRELALKDVVEILTEYTIEHSYFPERYYRKKYPSGIILPERKLILTDKEEGIESKRYSIIHELLHAMHCNFGDLGDLTEKTGEIIIDAETEIMYEKLYGVRPNFLKK